MTTNLPPTVTRRGLRAVGAAAVLLAALLVGALPAGAQTTTTEAGAVPTAAFCEAWADYQDAQDGAELNTALGEMEAALTPDAPTEVAEAIVTLGEGDLDPADVLAASDVVAAWADEPCAEGSTTTTTEATTTTTEATSTTATTAPSSTTSTTADSDDGDAPSGGADTGAGGTATGDGPGGLALGLGALALIAGGVGVAVANRRRLADRP